MRQVFSTFRGFTIPSSKTTPYRNFVRTVAQWNQLSDSEIEEGPASTASSAQCGSPRPTPSTPQAAPALLKQAGGSDNPTMSV